MNSVSRNVYVDRLYDVVNEYNNSYHRTIKMKPVDVKDNTHIDFKKEANIKILNLKLASMSEFLNTKIFSLKDTPQTGLKKFL